MGGRLLRRNPDAHAPRLRSGTLVDDYFAGRKPAEYADGIAVRVPGPAYEPLWWCDGHSRGNAALNVREVGSLVVEPPMGTGPCANSHRQEGTRYSRGKGNAGPPPIMAKLASNRDANQVLKVIRAQLDAGRNKRP